MNIKSPEIIFIIFAFVFGIIIMFVTPKFQVADGPAHFLRAEEVSKGNFYNGLPKNRKDNYEYHCISGHSPIMYISSGLGLKTGKLLTSEKYAFYFGRFFNLLVWIALIFLAIKITPIFKWQFLFVALWPMSIYEGMSLSADSFNNAFAFLFFAYIFKIIFEKKDILTNANMSIISTLTLIGAMCKGVLYPPFLLFTSKISKNKKAFITLIVIISILISVLWKANNYTNIYPGVNPAENKYFLLHNPIQIIKMFIITCIHYLPNWAGQAIGKLGQQTIKLNNCIYFLTFGLFISSFFFIPEKYKISVEQKLMSTFLFISYTFFTAVLMYINWTLPSEQYIQGIQGRYFLPVMPLTFIIIAPKLINLKNKYTKTFKISLVIYIFGSLCYSIFVLLKNFQIYIN